MNFHEAHVERLIGKKVVDSNGRHVGKLEEMIVEIIDGEPVVTEFHVGSGAALERFAAFVKLVPFFGWMPRGRTYCIPWQSMDLSDPRRPAVRADADRMQTFLLREPAAR